MLYFYFFISFIHSFVGFCSLKLANKLASLWTRTLSLYTSLLPAGRTQSIIFIYIYSKSPVFAWWWCTPFMIYDSLLSLHSTSPIFSSQIESFSNSLSIYIRILRLLWLKSHFDWSSISAAMEGKRMRDLRHLLAITVSRRGARIWSWKWKEYWWNTVVWCVEKKNTLEFCLQVLFLAAVVKSERSNTRFLLTDNAGGGYFFLSLSVFGRW